MGFLGEQSIPEKLIINDLNTLAEILGKTAIERLDILHIKFKKLVQLSSNPNTQKRIFENLINHLEMIENSGISYAIGNARDEIKAAADYIADTNVNDGVLKELKRLLAKNE